MTGEVETFRIRLVYALKVAVWCFFFLGCERKFQNISDVQMGGNIITFLTPDSVVPLQLMLLSGHEMGGG